MFKFRLLYAWLSLFVEINAMRSEAGRGARDASSFPLTFFEKAIDILNLSSSLHRKNINRKKSIS